MLMNGKDINEAIEDKGGPVAAALIAAQRRGSPSGVVEELYLSTLNRKPTPEEMKKILSSLGLVLQNKPKTPLVFWEQAAQDILWAILNGGEFILNH